MSGEYMKRKDFYIEYYNRTNRVFSDTIVWGKKERQTAWRKGQHYTSKIERLSFIIIQYLALFLSWIPMCFDFDLWKLIPISIIISILISLETDFSFIKIEILYFIYKTDNVFCSILHNIFLGDFGFFLDDLKKLTKPSVNGYIFKSGGKFYGKFLAICRNRNNSISIKFKFNSVIIKINGKKTTINNKALSLEKLVSEISSVINTTIN